MNIYFYNFLSFLSAFLFCLLQFIVATQLLPLFGGVHSTWLVSLYHAQLMLFGGFLYAYIMHRVFTPKLCITVHTLLLIYTLMMGVGLEFTGSRYFIFDNPRVSGVMMLVSQLSLLFIILGSTTLILQMGFKRIASINHISFNRWFKVGCVVAIAYYIFYVSNKHEFIEKLKGWESLYILFVTLFVCGWVYALKVFSKYSDDKIINSKIVILTSNEKMSCFFKGLMTSAYLYSISTFISSSLVGSLSVWGLILSVYLFSFIIILDLNGQLFKRSQSLIPILLLLSLVFLKMNNTQTLIIHLLTFFVVCLCAHNYIYRIKQKTIGGYYLYFGIGSIIGATSVLWVAPLFNGKCEYIISLILAYVLSSTRVRQTVFRVFISILIAVIYYLWIAYGVTSLAKIHHKSRDEYGVNTVMSSKLTNTKYLIYGETLRGGQSLDENRSLDTVLYFEPIEEIFRWYKDRNREIDVLTTGLGVGNIACLTNDADKLTFLEINPNMKTIVSEHFTFIDNCKPDANIVIGEPRKYFDELNSDVKFNIIIVDSFFSGAIPAHLVSIESINEYTKHLYNGGVILFHVSNRYLNYSSLLNKTAEEIGFTALRKDKYMPVTSISDVRDGLKRVEEGESGYNWVLLTKNEELLEFVSSVDTSDNDSWSKISETAAAVWNDKKTRVYEILEF